MEQMPLPGMLKKAVVVFSGGQDSTTCLFNSLSKGYQVYPLTINYGQRHYRELSAANKIHELATRAYKYQLASLEILSIGSDALKSSSPLTSKNELEQYKDHHSLPGGLEKTFVPMRNQLFLTLAANRAAAIGAEVLVTGVCEADYGGYPDCRQAFIHALEGACNLGTFTGEPGAPRPLSIETPLMHLTKAESVHLALKLPGCYAALAHSHTSYDGAYPPVGKDHATLLRAKGFEEADVPDPLILRAYCERLMKLPETNNYRESNVRAYASLAELRLP